MVLLKRKRAARARPDTNAHPTRFQEAGQDLPLTTKEGFRQFALASRPQRPAACSPTLLNELGAAERKDYDRQRHRWHANLGPYRLRFYTSITEQLWTAVDSNAQGYGRIRPSVLIDGLAGVGKTTVIERFGRDFYLDRISDTGQTPAGHEQIPVVYTTLTGKTTDRSLNVALVDFFGLPTRGSAKELGIRLRNAMVECRTELVIVDDIHFLDAKIRAGVQLSNHLKSLASESAATWVFAGIDVVDGDLLRADENLSKSQTARRWTALTLTRLDVSTAEDRREWHSLLKALTYDIELAHKSRHMLLNLDGYLYDRSQGVLGSLMTLIQRACYLAIRRGTEYIDRALLDEITLDHAAHTLRRRTPRGEESLESRREGHVA